MFEFSNCCDVPRIDKLLVLVCACCKN